MEILHREEVWECQIRWSQQGTGKGREAAQSQLGRVRNLGPVLLPRSSTAVAAHLGGREAAQGP